MSKFFYRDALEIMPEYGKSGFTPRGNVKLGTTANPLTLTVNSQARKDEVALIATEHKLVANITVDEAAEENLRELNAFINTPKTQQVEKTPERNAPCPCGSGKKYKKCCS